jgi:hypothetical protein
METPCPWIDYCGHFATLQLCSLRDDYFLEVCQHIQIFMPSECYPSKEIYIENVVSYFLQVCESTWNWDEDTLNAKLYSLDNNDATFCESHRLSMYNMVVCSLQILFGINLFNLLTGNGDWNRLVFDHIKYSLLRTAATYDAVKVSAENLSRLSMYELQSCCYSLNISITGGHTKMNLGYIIALDMKNFLDALDNKSTSDIEEEIHIIYHLPPSNDVRRPYKKRKLSDGLVQAKKIKKSN